MMVLHHTIRRWNVHCCAIVISRWEGHPVVIGVAIPTNIIKQDVVINFVIHHVLAQFLAKIKIGVGVLTITGFRNNGSHRDSRSNTA